MSQSILIDFAVKAGLGSPETFKLVGHGEKLINLQSGKTYIAKVGTNVAQIMGEAEGLKRMGATAPGLVPKLHVATEIENGQRAVFISDYIELGRCGQSSMTRLAERMSKELHNPKNQADDVRGYGFPCPTHCGVTEQDNASEWVI